MSIVNRAARVAPEKQASNARLAAARSIPGVSVLETKMSTYTELLKDPRWQRKRLEILNRSDFHCEQCGTGEKTLHVHHRFYRKGAMPWDYAEHELIVLCEDCHESIHDLRASIERSLGMLNTELLEYVAGYVDSLVLCAKQDGSRLIVRAGNHAAGVTGALIENRRISQWVEAASHPAGISFNDLSRLAAIVARTIDIEKYPAITGL